MAEHPRVERARDRRHTDRRRERTAPPDPQPAPGADEPAGPEPSEPQRPPTRWVRSAAEGWIEVEEGNAQHWDDDHLWHTHPPR